MASQNTVHGDAPNKVTFNRDIRPILAENCFGCHGPDSLRRKADLRLDTPEGALANRGGHSAIVAGQPEKSELIARITASDPAQRMPPSDSQKTLSETQKALLQRWIKEGAEYEGHWAFAPLRRPVVPTLTSQKEWIRNPIDAFVLARLATENVSPPPEADKRTLLRRVYFDLIGLPPTPGEIDAYLADTSVNAYEKVVDKLLATRHYGER